MALVFAGYIIESITDDRGNALKDEPFTVVDTNDNPITLYGDPARMTTAPSTTDERGMAKFWADADIGPLVVTLTRTGVQYDVQPIPDGRDINSVYTEETFIWTQAVPSSNWVVAHNLGRYPSVTVVDSTLHVIDADTRYIDANSLAIMPSGAMAGYAYLN